jgi:hypothetical protein
VGRMFCIGGHFVKEGFCVGGSFVAKEVLWKTLQYVKGRFVEGRFVGRTFRTGGRYVARRFVLASLFQYKAALISGLHPWCITRCTCHENVNKCMEPGCLLQKVSHW